MRCVVRIIGQANGRKSPHDGRFVKAWNPHTIFGLCDIETADSLADALVFEDAAEAFMQWRMRSDVEPNRPTDGAPNRPLTGLTIEIIKKESIQ